MKLFKKLTTLVAGLTMALGIGLVADHGARAEKAKAADRVLGYTITNVNAATETGDSGNEFAFTGTASGATYNSSYTRIQITNGNKYTITISNFSNYVVTDIVLGMNSNGSAGRGYVNIKNGTTQIANKGNTGDNFNTWNDDKAWAAGTAAANPTSPVTFSGLSITGSNLVIEIACVTNNSLYIKTVSITFHEQGPVIPEEVTAVIDAINAIGTVTLGSETAIVNAENAYDALTEEQQGLVTNYEILTAARAAYDLLVEQENNAEQTANAFMAKVDALHAKTIVVEDESEIEDLEAEYATYAGTVKTLIDGAGYATKIADIKQRLEVAIAAAQQAADQAAADIVIAMVNALPEASAINTGNYETYEPVAEDAKNAYDLLTVSQKGLVTNYAKLEAVLAAIAVANPSPVEVYKHTFGGTLSADWSATSGATFATNYYRIGLGGTLTKTTSFSLASNVKKFVILVKSVTNNASTSSNIVIDGLDKNGNVVNGSSATFIPHNTSASNGTQIDAVINNADYDRTVEIVGQGVERIKVTYDSQNGGGTANWVIREITVSAVYGSSTVDVESVSLDKESINLEIGKTSQLTAVILPEDATNKEVTYSTSAATIATVTAGGLIEAIGVGTATITVTADGGKTDTCLVTVTKAPSTGFIPEDVPPEGNGSVAMGDIAFIQMMTGHEHVALVAGGAQYGTAESVGKVEFESALMTITPEDLDKIVIKMSTLGNATLSVYVGGTKIGATVNLTAIPTDYEFVPVGGAASQALGRTDVDGAGHLIIVAEGNGITFGGMSVYGAEAAIAAAKADSDMMDVYELLMDADTCNDYDIAPDLRDMLETLTLEEQEQVRNAIYIANGGAVDTLGNKLNYMLKLYAAKNAEPSGLSPLMELIKDPKNLIAVLIIGVAGLTAIGAYYFINKKRLASY